MENPKALQTFIDLEQARCNERWNDIPELAKRYKKYHPYQSVLEFTARMEAEFILLVRQWRHESGTSTASATASQVDLPSSAPSTPTPSTTNNSQGARKWGNRQLLSQIGTSSTNLNNTTVTTIKRSYPEESDFCYQLDDPNNVSLLPRLPPSHVQLILVRLLDVIQRQIKSGELETPDDWQAQFSKIVLARIYFESGRYDKALEWLQHLALRLEDVETGYGLVLLVQARVIKGVCFEMQENYADALDSYLGALKVVEQHPEEKSKSLFFWLEDCLYRSVLLQLQRKGPVKQTLKLMRTYLQYCCTEWPTNWRIHKRWVIFRHYIRYLTRAYQKGVYVPASPDDEYINPASPILSPTRSVFSEAGETTLFERSAAALDETIQLMTQFRSLLAAFAPLLNKKNPIDLNHRTLELSNLLVSAHDTVGWGPIEYVRRTFRYLNRSRKFTFNSLCITRHLFHTLLRLGEIQEAKLALMHYFELLGVPHLIDKETLRNETQQKTVPIHGDSSDEEVSYLEEYAETIQDRLEYILHESQASANKNLLALEKKLSELEGLPESEDEEDEQVEPMPKKKAPVGSCENDTEFDVVRLILAAAKQLYGQLCRNGQEATILSDVAVALLEESEHLKRKKASQWKSLMVQARRVRGSSYSLYSTQCCDEKKRSEYHVEALMSYKRAAELDSRSWQTYYELGLQQAIMGDVISASSSVKRSIKLRGDFIPSWHLLALIQSAHQFNALPKSLQLIQAGLGYHMNMVENFDNEDEPDLVFTLDTTEGLEFFDRAEAYMCLRMSQTYFLETLEGAEAVLKIYPDLFDMYGKLSKKMNLDIAIAASEKESALGRRKSSTLSQHRQDSVKSLSHPRSRSNTINNSSIRSSSSIFDDNDSLNCSSFALPPTAEDDDDAVFNIDHTLQIHQESELTRSSTQIRVTEKEEPEEEEVVALDRKKSKHKQRRSISTTRQLMDDPLLSLHLVNKKKKEKKEPKPKKTGFLSFRSSISNNSSNPSSPSPDSLGQKKEPSSNILKETMSQEDLTSSSLILQESTFNMSSNNSVKPSLVNQQQQQSSYFSILPQLNQQDQQSTSSSPVSTVHKNAYYAVRQDRWQMILVKIWIMASATYTRAQRCDEAFKAIAEADQLTSGNNADVWHQIGLIIMRQRGPDYLDRALDAFKRALSIDPEHVATHTSLASVYLDIQQVELAEQLLERSTKGLGWNQTEAWYMLSKVYREQENILDAKNSLTFALMLSDSSPIQPLDSLPRFV